MMCRRGMGAKSPLCHLFVETDRREWYTVTKGSRNA